VIVFLVGFEMLRKVRNALGEDCDLNKGRTRIFRVFLVVLHEIFLF